MDELWVINTIADRPELETYKYALPEEDNHYQDEIMVFSMDTHEGIRLDTDKWPDQSLGGVYFNNGGIYTSDESDYLWILRRTRTWDEIDVVKANPGTGETEVLWSEKSEPYFNVMNAYLGVINNGMSTSGGANAPAGASSIAMMPMEICKTASLTGILWLVTLQRSTLQAPQSFLKDTETKRTVTIFMLTTIRWGLMVPARSF